MKIFKIKNRITPISILTGYIKRFGFLIILLWIIVFFSNLCLIYKLPLFILSFFVPGYTIGCISHRIIYKVSVDENNKRIIINYFIIWKSKISIPFNHLHTESYINQKNNKEIWEMFFAKKNNWVIGSIVSQKNEWKWDKNTLIELSEILYNIKIVEETWRANEYYLYPTNLFQQGNIVKRVEFFQ